MTTLAVGFLLVVEVAREDEGGVAFYATEAGLVE